MFSIPQPSRPVNRWTAEEAISTQKSPLTDRPGRFLRVSGSSHSPLVPSRLHHRESTSQMILRFGATPVHGTLYDKSRWQTRASISAIDSRKTSTLNDSATHSKVESWNQKT